MAHKVAVEKIDWDGIANELESIEKPKNPKSNRVYVIGAAFIGILLLFTSLNIMILAQTPTGFPTVIEPGSMVGGASYVIFTDDATYYAKNGKTGAIDFSGANLALVVNAVLNTFTVTSTGTAGDGGTIVFQSGFYNLTAPISIAKPFVTIRGSNEYGTWLTKIGAIDAFVIQGGADRVVEITIENMLIQNSVASDGGAAVRCQKSGSVQINNLHVREFKEGMYFKDTYGVHINDCQFDQCGDTATTKPTLWFDGTDVLSSDICTHVRVIGCALESGKYVDIRVTGMWDKCLIDGNYFEASPTDSYASIVAEHAQGVEIMNNWMSVGQGFGIKLGMSGVGNLTVMSRVIGNWIEHYGGVGIDAGLAAWSIVANNQVRFCGGDSGIIPPLKGTCEGNTVQFCDGDGIDITNTDVTVTGNVVEGNGRVTGLTSAGIRVRCNYTTVVGNYVYDNGGANTTQAYGILVENKIALIAHNTVRNATVQNIWVAGPIPDVHGNSGWVTENSGNVTITGAFSTVTVNHGLVATPAIVIVSVNSTGAGNYSVSSITSTQFIISFTNQPGANEWLFYWYAEV